MTAVVMFCQLEVEITADSKFDSKNYQPQVPPGIHTGNNALKGSAKYGAGHGVVVVGQILAKNKGILSAKHVMRGEKIPKYYEVWQYKGSKAGLKFIGLIQPNDFTVAANDDLSVIDLTTLTKYNDIASDGKTISQHINETKHVEMTDKLMIGDIGQMVAFNYSPTDSQSQGMRFISGIIPGNDQARTWTCEGVSGAPVFLGSKLCGIHVAGYKNGVKNNIFVPIQRVKAFLNSSGTPPK